MQNMDFTSLFIISGLLSYLEIDPEQFQEHLHLMLDEAAENMDIEQVARLRQVVQLMYKAPWRPVVVK